MGDKDRAVGRFAVVGNGNDVAQEDQHRSAFERDWQARYAGRGTFEDFAPAYDYGRRLRARDSRSWDLLHDDARDDWERDRPGTWDSFKDAIRFAWEHLTGTEDEHSSMRKP